jgi:hypothetical protein
MDGGATLEGLIRVAIIFRLGFRTCLLVIDTAMLYLTFLWP